MISIFVGRSSGGAQSRNTISFFLPERGLHPRDQVAFAFWLVRRQKGKPLQNFMVETYSEVILKSLNKAMQGETVEAEAFDENKVPASLGDEGFVYPSMEPELKFLEGSDAEYTPVQWEPKDPWT